MKTKIRSGLVPCCLTTLVCLAGPLAAQVPHLLHHQGRVAVDGVNFTGSGQFKFSLVDGGRDVSHQATATATVTNGFVTSVEVDDRGIGYDPGSPPAVTINSKTGSGAVLVPVILAGSIASVTVSSTGSGYSSLDTVTIGAPPELIVYQQFWSNDGSGTGGSEPALAVQLAVAGGLFEVLLGDVSLTNMTAVPASVFENPDLRVRTWFSDGSHGFQQLSPDKRIAAVGYALMAEGVPDGAIGSAQLAADAVQASNIAAGAITSGKIAAGAVGKTQLASGAVQATHIARGAVGSAQIAPGAITATELAKPPRSGSIASTSLQIDFNRASFTVPFSPAFSATPMIALTCSGSFAGGATPSVWVEASGPASLSGSFSSPIEPITLDSDGDVGGFTSLAMVDGSPAISYYDSTNHDLKFFRSAGSDGSSYAWLGSAPRTVDSGGLVGSYTSLAVVNGNPAISYLDNANASLKFVRASGADGGSWGTPVTPDGSGNVGGGTSLAVVNGHPAICYHDFVNDDLKFVRASDANGTAWQTPVTPDGSGDVGLGLSLVVVNGRPAISYFDSTNDVLKFTRATDASGTGWGTPLSLDNLDHTSATSLAVVDGFPAISYHCDTGPSQHLRFIRATNANGTAWGAPIIVDSDLGTGQFCSLAVVNGYPAISYLDTISGDLKYVRATNAGGTAWGTPLTLDSSGFVGASTSLVMVDGNPAISYFDATNHDLKFVRAPDPPTFTIQWIALEP